MARVLQKAKNLGCLTLVDPLTPYKHGWNYITHALEWIDIFHCNNDEARDITGKHNPYEAARVLIDKGANLVVISLGEKGAYSRN